MKPFIKKRQVLICVLLSVLGVLFYCTRFFMTGIPHYKWQDTIFHCERLMGLGNVWTSPVNFYTFGGKGSYVNLFYPWLTMYPMWILYRIFNSYVVAYKIYYTLLGIVTLFVSYYSMKKIVADDMISISFAALFSFSSYRFANIYIRGSLGECIAIAFLPLILAGMYCVFFEDHKKWRILSVGIAVMSYTHILSILMSATVIMLFMGFTFYWWDRKRDRLLSFVKAVAVSIGLSFGSLIPMVQASLLNNVYHPEGKPEILYNSSDDLAQILYNSISNLPSYRSIGLTTFVALVLTLYLLSKYKTDKELLKRRNAWLLCVFGISIVLVASRLLPWKVIGCLPLISIIQFIWRLNSYSTLFITAAFCVALAAAGKSNRFRTTMLICVACVLLTWSSVLNILGTEEMRITDEKLASIVYLHKDYSTMPAAEALIKDGNALSQYYINGNEILPETSISENGSILYVNINEARANDELDIPVYCFTTLRALVNGKPTSVKLSERGTVLLTIPSDGNVSIEIYHVYTKLTYISWVFSFLLLVALIWTAVAKGKRKTPMR